MADAVQRVLKLLLEARVEDDRRRASGRNARAPDGFADAACVNLAHHSQ
jgi:hypothetical protein